jgi:hypothetical protein
VPRTSIASRTRARRMILFWLDANTVTVTGFRSWRQLTRGCHHRHHRWGRAWLTRRQADAALALGAVPQVSGRMTDEDVRRLPLLVVAEAGAERHRTQLCARNGHESCSAVRSPTRLGASQQAPSPVSVLGMRCSSRNRCSGTMSGIDEPPALHHNGAWRMAVWPHRVGYLALARASS